MKKFLLYLLGILLITATGCGNAKEKKERKEFYYVPEYRELTFDVNNVSSIAVADDTLYMVGNSWNDESYEISTKFMTYQLTAGSYTEMPMALNENEMIQQLFWSEEGKLLAVAYTYESNDETGEYREKHELWELSAADGSIINRTDLAAAFEGAENFYLQYGTVDGEGNLYLSDGSQGIYVIDKEGTLIAAIPLNDWIESLFIDKDNRVYVKQWGAEGEEIKPVDIASKALGDPVAASNLTRGSNNYNQKYYKGSDTSLMISDTTGVYTYDFATDTATDIFDWLDADINSDNVDALGQLSDGRFWVLIREWKEEGAEYSFALLTKTPASEVPEKEELTFGTMYLSQDMRQSIIDFNKSSDKYRITVREYENEDYNASLLQFNNELTSGNCPDIINLAGLNFDRYAGKGVFEDLYPYMEKDGMQTEDYLVNVLKAYETEGKLYAVTPQFSVSSAVIKTSHVGDAKGWTLPEMLTVAQSSGAEEIFSYGNRYNVFSFCVYNTIDEFIDWETGECYFDSEDFISVMEFAAQFPEEYDYNAERDGLSVRIRDDRLLLLENGISSVQEYQMLKGMFGEEITFIGYPNSQRKGNLIRSNNGELAIAAKSKNKEAAWEFVKVFLSEEYQDSLVEEHGGWGFPIRKSSLEKQFGQDMTPDYYEDEAGNQKENPKTSWGYDDFQIDIYAATQEEVEAVKEVLESAEMRAGSVDEELVNIITEEAEAFFKGQKSAKDTADIIQNRIKIYVSENS